MQADKVPMLTPLQQGFIDACFRVDGDKQGKLTAKVLRSLDRTKPKQERGWDAKVSYRTAQKLKQQEVL
jgi:hypothetical protein